MTGSWNDFNDAQNTSVIPKGVIAKGRLTIRDDPAQGWTGGYATRGDSGAVYLNTEFTVLEGPYARRKIFTLIGLYSPKGPEWANMGRALIKGILNSARGVSEKDISPEAQAGASAASGISTASSSLPVSTSAMTSTAIRRTRSARRSPRTTGTTPGTWAGPSRRHRRHRLRPRRRRSRSPASARPGRSDRR